MLITQDTHSPSVPQGTPCTLISKSSQRVVYTVKCLDLPELTVALDGCRYRQADKACQVALASSTAKQAHQAGLGSFSTADYSPSRFTQLLQVVLL